MIDLSTNYLGLELRSPLVASASPLSQEIDGIRRLADAGASAIVLYSLFEEQLRHEAQELDYHLSTGTESFAESLTYFPTPGEFRTGPEAYLCHIEKAKRAVQIPIIASLNGATLGGWTKYARAMEDAGADAIECNIYFVAANMIETGFEVEQRYIDIVRAVKASVRIPIAVKVGPFFSNMASMAKWLVDAGADGLVLFNRFYQPDIDLNELEIRPNVLLSTPQDLRLPLTWIGILYGRVRANLAATSGVHSAEDAIKLLMAGADVTMLCSALLRNGPTYLRTVEEDLRAWMGEHEYESVQQMRGSMSQLRCADPSGFERAQYMRAVKDAAYIQRSPSAPVTRVENWGPE